MRHVSAEDFSTLVGSIYDCALDPALWPETLGALRERMMFLSATLAVVEMPTGKGLINAAHGIDPPWLAALGQYGKEIMDQWGGAERVRDYPLDVPMILSDVNPHALTLANRYHREVCAPRGVVNSLTIGLLRELDDVRCRDVHSTQIRRPRRPGRGRARPPVHSPSQAFGNHQPPARSP